MVSVEVLYFFSYSFSLVVQAPGLYQGYAPQIFPGITQAIQNDNASVAQAQIQLTSFFINKAANFLQTGSGDVTHLE